MSDATRRDFLKASTVTAVGAGVLGGLSSVSSGAFVSGDDTIRVGVIGCGGRGTQAAGQALSTAGNVKLVAMADAFKDRLDGSLKRLERQFRRQKGRVAVNEERKFVGFNAYQELIDCGVDVVVMATPPGFRPMHFEAAIKAGKHVFAEKPLATDGPGIKRVLAAVAEAKKKNLKVGIGLQRHHQNTYLETMKRLKEDKIIGDIVSMRCYWNNPGVWVKLRQQGQTEMEYQMRNWYYFNWLCGDHIVEQHIHNIDVCNWLKGKHPVAAEGMGGRQVRTGNEYGEIYDHHAVEFIYDDETRMYSYCRHTPGAWTQVSEFAQGTKGHAAIKDATITQEGGKVWRYEGKRNAPYQTEHDDLFAAIRKDTPYNEGEYGAHSTMTAILGRMATYSGKVIKFDDALNKGANIMPKEFAWDAETPTKPNADGSYDIPVPGKHKVLG